MRTRQSWTTMHPVCPALPSPPPSALFFFFFFAHVSPASAASPDRGAAADLRLKNDPLLALHRSINSQPQKKKKKMAAGTHPAPISRLITAEFTQNVLNTAGNVPVIFFHIEQQFGTASRRRSTRDTGANQLADLVRISW